MRIRSKGKQCTRCQSTDLRESEARSLGGFFAHLAGFRALRCQRCLARFYAFAPRLAPPAEPPAPPKPAELPTRVHHTDPLLEIQLIEVEWRESIQPTNLIEETLCGQLAHATWHLRELNRTEREAIAHSVRNRSFDGDAAVRLMQWRRSSEASIEAALAQLAAFRGQPQPGAVAGPTDLSRLASAVDVSGSRTLPVIASRK